ncbi:MoaD/ThiS family protein [Sinosporangium siamense]|uniref:Thiamine biosynthesis protein ThiS n=1 Tax=Sinosporangium siamense TaxID=1367973 RepID=A0A919RGD1_9ACTN|nr:MoaD/ThiS family protein [Sinosporangium siamense]GII93396.1 thiamine biosynthesis protein ThiS [Sinosporangium siamense]
MPKVTIRYWAAARSAAGTAEEVFEAATLAELLGEATRGRADLARVVGLSSLLIDGAPVGTRDPAAMVLQEGAAIEVLPPYAGG